MSSDPPEKDSASAPELEPEAASPPRPPPAKSERPGPPSSALPPPAFKSRFVSKLPPKNPEPRTVADAMTRKVIAIEAGSTIEHVEEGMRRFHFRHLPIVDGKNHVLGLLSHRDLMHAESSSLSADREQRDAMIRARATVEQIMHKDVITVGPDELLSKAGELMLEREIGCLPVVDGNDQLVGIISRSDFVRLAIKALPQI